MMDINGDFDGTLGGNGRRVRGDVTQDVDGTHCQIDGNVLKNLRGLRNTVNGDVREDVMGNGHTVRRNVMGNVGGTGHKIGGDVHGDLLGTLCVIDGDVHGEDKGMLNTVRGQVRRRNRPQQQQQQPRFHPYGRRIENINDFLGLTGAPEESRQEILWLTGIPTEERRQEPFCAVIRHLEPEMPPPMTTDALCPDYPSVPEDSWLDNTVKEDKKCFVCADMVGIWSLECDNDNLHVDCLCYICAAKYAEMKVGSVCPFCRGKLKAMKKIKITHH